MIFWLTPCFLKLRHFILTISRRTVRGSSRTGYPDAVILKRMSKTVRNFSGSHQRLQTPSSGGGGGRRLSGTLRNGRFPISRIDVYSQPFSLVQPSRGSEASPKGIVDVNRQVWR